LRPASCHPSIIAGKRVMAMKAWMLCMLLGGMLTSFVMYPTYGS
jgi:hypothetical protein